MRGELQRSSSHRSSESVFWGSPLTFFCNTGFCLQSTFIFTTKPFPATHSLKQSTLFTANIPLRHASPRSSSAGQYSSDQRHGPVPSGSAHSHGRRPAHDAKQLSLPPLASSAPRSGPGRSHERCLWTNVRPDSGHVPHLLPVLPSTHQRWQQNLGTRQIQGYGDLD